MQKSKQRTKDAEGGSAAPSLRAVAVAHTDKAGEFASSQSEIISKTRENIAEVRSQLSRIRSTLNKTDAA